MQEKVNKIQGGYGPAQRNSNLELFRIITMLLIIAHHYVINSGLMGSDGPIYTNPCAGKSIFLLLFGAWGKTAINCFVLITGYFMCKSQITAKKFAKLLLEIMFYRIVINAVFWITGYTPFSWSAFIQMLIPITTITASFTSAFLCFYLFIPFLNVLVHNLNEKQHIKLLFLCAFVYVFFGTAKVLKIFSVDMNYVSWFIVLYLIASYIRLYAKPAWENTKLWAWMTVGFLAISSLSVIGCAWLGGKIGKEFAYIFVVDSNTVFALMTALSAFMLFKNLKIKNSIVINTVSASCFGVLLIHAGGDSMRKWLWGDVLSNVQMYDSDFLVLHAILSVIAIYAVCTAIDFLRIQLLEKPFFGLWDKKWNAIADAYRKTEVWICEKLGISTVK